jgi:glycosyltransferase involved in cell wall biosynthesis
MKKVSVIIPTYNSAGTLVDTVKSVLDQTYPDIEIIIVDDGSTDDTKKVLEPYLDSICYIYQDNNGTCSARNAGFEASKGEYIAFLDSDDLYHSTKIEYSIGHLESNPDIGFVHNPAIYINEKGMMAGIHYYLGNMMTDKFSERILLSNWVCNSTVVMRRSSLEAIDTIKKTVFAPADWDMWIRLSEKFRCGYINRPLSFYRLASRSIYNDIEKNFKEELIILEEVFKRKKTYKISFKNKCFSNTYFRCANWYRRNSQIDQAKEMLKTSLKYDRFNLLALIQIFVCSLPEPISQVFFMIIEKVVFFKKMLIASIFSKRMGK